MQVLFFLGDERVHLVELRVHLLGGFVADVFEARPQLVNIVFDFGACFLKLVFALLNDFLVIGSDVFDKLVDRGDKLLAVAFEDLLDGRQIVHAFPPVTDSSGPAKPAGVAICLERAELAVDVVFKILRGFCVAGVEAFHRLRLEVGKLLFNFVLRGRVDAVDLRGDFFALFLERALCVFLLLTSDAEVRLTSGGHLSALLRLFLF